MFNKYLTLAAVVVCTANAVNGYMYEVIDCMKPSRVNEYQLNSICPKVEVQQSMVEEEILFKKGIMGTMFLGLIANRKMFLLHKVFLGPFFSRLRPVR